MKRKGLIEVKIGQLFKKGKEKTMKEEKVPVQEKKLEKVTGGGAFDDVPTVDEHPYDDPTRIVTSSNPVGDTVLGSKPEK